MPVKILDKKCLLFWFRVSTLLNECGVSDPLVNCVPNFVQNSLRPHPETRWYPVEGGFHGRTSGSW